MKCMRKKIAALALASCLGATLLPATALAAEGDAPERGTLRYTEVIAPQYDNADMFSNGLAPVEKNGKWGYINTDNETVIPFQYDIAGLFNEGYAIVGDLIRSEPEIAYNWETGESYETGGTYYTYELGFVDTEGSYTPFLYECYDENGSHYEPLTWWTMETAMDRSVCFHNGYICLNYPDSSDMLLYDTTGYPVDLGDIGWRCAYGYQVTENILIVGAAPVEGGDQAYLNLETGKLMDLNVPDDSFVALRPFNQGLAFISYIRYDSLDPETNMYESLWGVIDKTGKFVIQPGYTSFWVFDIYGDYEVFGETGLAMVQNTAGKWGAIDKSGKTVISFNYDQLYNYSFGLAAFEQNGKFGFLDDKGAVAIPAQYEEVTSFSGDGYAVAYDGEKAFLIDDEGNAIPGADQLSPDSYFSYERGSEEPVIYTPDEYVVIEENGKYGYGHVEYAPALPEEGEMSSWAFEEVTAAIEEDLVPNYLQNLYLNNINRAEFCDLAIQAIEEVEGKSIADIVQEQTGRSLDSWRQEYPFYDSSESNVIAAYALGIVTGRGGGEFDPYAPITRQEAAAYLMRSAKVLGMDTSQVGSAGFNDDGSVGVWFKDAVNFVYQINVMSGTGNNNFSPLGNYTREQSYVTIYRLFQAVTAQA